MENPSRCGMENARHAFAAVLIRYTTRYREPSFGPGSSLQLPEFLSSLPDSPLGSVLHHIEIGLIVLAAVEIVAVVSGNTEFVEPPVFQLLICLGVGRIIHGIEMPN